MISYDHVPFRERLGGILAAWALAVALAALVAVLGAPTWGWVAVGALARLQLTSDARAVWIAMEMEARR